MSLWLRLSHAFRGERLSRKMDEDPESHVEDAAPSDCDPDEARRASESRTGAHGGDQGTRVIGWLHSVRADTIFGWRQLRRQKVASGAAILSLALAIGACVSAFRLIDALLLRPLPVSNPERLYSVAFVFRCESRQRFCRRARAKNSQRCRRRGCSHRPAIIAPSARS